MRTGDNAPRNPGGGQGTVPLTCQIRQDVERNRGHSRRAHRPSAWPHSRPGQPVRARQRFPSSRCDRQAAYDLRMRALGTMTSERRPRPGWAAVTLVIAAIFVVSLVQAGRLIVFEGAWWNIPGAILALALTYWVGVAAWRCIWAPSDVQVPGPQSGHTAGPNEVTRVL